MDLRTERTRKNIINAFIELRAKKPLERITVKELSDLAMINKATFYSHYKDIYDLSEKLEIDTINSIMMNVSDYDKLVEDPKGMTKELTIAFMSQIQLINILFSDSRYSILSDRLEKIFKEKIYEMHPEYNNLEWDIKLTMILQGNFRAFAANYKDKDVDEIINILGNVNERILKENYS